MAEVKELKKKLELRPLYGDDVFQVLELVNKLDLIDPLAELFTEKREEIIASVTADEKTTEKDGGATTTEIVGFEVLLEVSKLAISRIPKAKNELNSFLADLAETDEETIKKLPLSEYIELVKSFFTHPDFRELFQSLQELTK